MALYNDIMGDDQGLTLQDLVGLNEYFPMAPGYEERAIMLAAGLQLCVNVYAEASSRWADLAVAWLQAKESYLEGAGQFLPSQVDQMEEQVSHDRKGLEDLRLRLSNLAGVVIPDIGGQYVEEAFEAMGYQAPAAWCPPVQSGALATGAVVAIVVGSAFAVSVSVYALVQWMADATYQAAVVANNWAQILGASWGVDPEELQLQDVPPATKLEIPVVSQLGEAIGTAGAILPWVAGGAAILALVYFFK